MFSAQEDPVSHRFPQSGSSTVFPQVDTVPCNPYNPPLGLVDMLRQLLFLIEFDPVHDSPQNIGITRANLHSMRLARSK